jgi:hypothetical protein
MGRVKKHGLTVLLFTVQRSQATTATLTPDFNLRIRWSPSAHPPRQTGSGLNLAVTISTFVGAAPSKIRREGPLVQLLAHPPLTLLRASYGSAQKEMRWYLAVLFVPNAHCIGRAAVVRRVPHDDAVLPALAGRRGGDKSQRGDGGEEEPHCQYEENECCVEK